MAGKSKFYEPRICVVCGEEFTPRTKVQVTCGKPECIKEYDRRRKKGAYTYKHSKTEGLSASEKNALRENMSDKEWNSLSAKKRWELMSLEQVSAECLKFKIPSYGMSQGMAENGTLPEDFGRRVSKRGRKKNVC